MMIVNVTEVIAGQLASTVTLLLNFVKLPYTHNYSSYTNKLYVGFTVSLQLASYRASYAAI